MENLLSQHRLWTYIFYKPHVSKFQCCTRFADFNIMWTPLLSAAAVGGSSAPLMTGTIVYSVLTIIACCIVFCCVGSGRISKGDTG